MRTAVRGNSPGKTQKHRAAAAEPADISGYVPDRARAAEQLAAVLAVGQALVGMDGDEALKVAREQNPQLILLDIQMPKRSGFEVFTELQGDEKLSTVPVVILTGVAEKTGVGFSGSDMGEYLGKEPAAYIEKPIEPVVLKQTVKRLLG